MDEVADEARQIGRTVATTVSQASATVGNAVRTTSQSVGNTLRAAATAAVSTVRTAAERAAESVSNAARNVAVGALTAADDAVVAATPVAQRIVAAPFIGGHTVITRASAGAQAVLAGTSAVVEALRAENEERNPRFSERMELLQQAADGLSRFGENWGAILGMANEVRQYTADSILEGRWSDASRGLGGIGQMNATLAQFGGQVGLGMLAAPFTSAWEFGSALRERVFEGEGRELDVAMTGGDLALSLLGVYGAYSVASSMGVARNTASSVRMPNSGILQPDTPLYRVFGGEARGLGYPGKPSSWTTVSPDAVPNFRASAGLFEGNTGQFVIEGNLLDLEGVVVRQALPGPTTPSGAALVPDVVVPNATTQIFITTVSGVNPPY